MRLARVGHDTVRGYILFGDFEGDQQAVEQVSVTEAYDYTTSGRVAQFVDVRRPAEYAAGHAVHAVNASLSELEASIEGLDPAAPTFVICAGGYRSSIGTSILEKAGFSELYNVTGGTSAWTAAGLPVET